MENMPTQKIVLKLKMEFVYLVFEAIILGQIIDVQMLKIINIQKHIMNAKIVKMDFIIIERLNNVFNLKQDMRIVELLLIMGIIVHSVKVDFILTKQIIYVMIIMRKMIYINVQFQI